MVYRSVLKLLIRTMSKMLTREYFKMN